MITANKGSTMVAGTNYDVILEFNHIISTLLEDNPEIVISTIAAWSDTMDERLESANSIKLDIVLQISEEIIKLCKESEGNND